MEKFLWNVAGFALIVLNLFAMAYCFIEQTSFSGMMLIAMAVLDMVYTERRPTWVQRQEIPQVRRLWRFSQQQGRLGNEVGGVKSRPGWGG